MSKETPIINIALARDLCRKTSVVDSKTRNSEIYDLFGSDPSLLNIPVTDDDRIVGLINRDSFMRSMARHFHWELYSKKRCTKMLSNEEPLVFEASTPIRDLANELLQLNKAELFSEGFIVIEDGNILGTGMTGDVLAAMVQLERLATEELRTHRDRLAEILDQRTRDLEFVKMTEEKLQAENLLAKGIIDSLSLRHGLSDSRLQYWFQAAENFSGDAIAAAVSSEGKLYALVADATGHGLTAAISIVPVLTLFYRLVEQNSALEKIAHELNRELLNTMPTGRFVAASLVSIDPHTHLAEIWQGGMPEILHLDADGNVKERHRSNQFPLGIIDFSDDLKCVQVVGFNKGEQLVIFSDGLPEAENKDGDPFGMSRIELGLIRTKSSSQIENIRDAIELHLGSLLPHDDISLMLITSDLL